MYLRFSEALSVLALAASYAFANEKVKTAVCVLNDKDATNHDFHFDFEFEGFPLHGEIKMASEGREIYYSYID